MDWNGNVQTTSHFGTAFDAMAQPASDLGYFTNAAAAKHPVPLDATTDAATCIGCHQEKATGKSVHSAIAMGCTSCHEIRVNKDVTRVKLITTTPSSLCLTCHAEKNAAEIKGA